MKTVTIYQQSLGGFLKKKKKRKKRDRVRKNSRHHVLPSSRGGGNGNKNIILLPDSFHQAWHIVFGTLTPSESKQFINEIFLEERYVVSSGQLEKIRRRIIKSSTISSVIINLQHEES